MIEVTAAVICRDGKFLICQRPLGESCELLWEFPGGKIEPGETTADRKFTLESCRCIGACGLAPVLKVNEEVYGRLNKKKSEKVFTFIYKYII